MDTKAMSRLPTDDELEELYRVAERGIHPPDEMPFAVAWTDDLQHDPFVDFHRAADLHPIRCPRSNSAGLPLRPPSR